MSNTILLVHGAWLNSASWSAVKTRYEAKGFTVVAPDWPYDDRSPEELRQMPDEALSTLGQRAIIDHDQSIDARKPPVRRRPLRAPRDGCLLEIDLGQCRCASSSMPLASTIGECNIS